MGAGPASPHERANGTLRFLDRYLGIPLVSALAMLRSKRRSSPKTRTIGLLMTAAIGDTVLLAGPLSDLKAAFPKARIILFVGNSNYEAAELLDGAASVVPLPMRSIIRAASIVRQNPVDVMIDFGSWPRVNAFLTLASRASFTVGFRTPGQHRHYGYDAVVDHSPEVHEIENYRRLLGAIGVRGSHRPVLRPRFEELDPAWLGRRFLVFHLWPGGSRADLKLWPIENWARLAEELTDAGYDIALTGGEFDHERNQNLIGDLAIARRDKLFNVAGWPLSRVASLLSKARLVVSVDTGVMHLAAALGTPLVALHGPTSPQRWGPLSNRAITIESPLPGSGYLSLGWDAPASPPACMESISYAKVREACLSALEPGAFPMGPKLAGTVGAAGSALSARKAHSTSGTV
jgi:ADP-heptose:LPS heptosyltransferase